MINDKCSNWQMLAKKFILGHVAKIENVQQFPFFEPEAILIYILNATHMLDQVMLKQSDTVSKMTFPHAKAISNQIFFNHEIMYD